MRRIILANSVLMGASRNGHIDIIEILLNNNVDVNAVNLQGNTALINASWLWMCRSRDNAT